MFGGSGLVCDLVVVFLGVSGYSGCCGLLFVFGFALVIWVWCLCLVVVVLLVGLLFLVRCFGWIGVYCIWFGSLVT